MQPSRLPASLYEIDTYSLPVDAIHSATGSAINDPTTYRAVYSCPCAVRRRCRPRHGISRAYSLLRIRPLMRALWAISSRWSLGTEILEALGALFPLLTSNRSSEPRGRTEKVEAEVMPMKEEQYEQRQRQRQHHDAKNRMRWGGKGKSRGQACYKRKKDPSGKGRWGRKGDPTYLRRAKERSRTGSGSEASQRRQDRRRQPAITSWNVWERVGLDPKGPATTKSPPSLLFSSPPLPSPLSYPSASLLPTFINGYSVRPLPCTGWPREYVETTWSRG